jgi:hypothetical protein
LNEVVALRTLSAAMPPSSSTTADRPRSSRHRSLLILAWLLLTIYFLAPPREVFDQTLDRSNHATYSYFLTHGLKWGVDVLPMAGPLGFVLYGSTYSGELFGTRLVADLLIKAAFAVLLLQLFRRAGPGALRWVWLGGMVVALPLVNDLFFDAAVLVAAISLLLAPEEKSTRGRWLPPVMLGFIALIKGTHPTICGLVIATVVTLNLIERRPRRAVQTAATFLAALLVFWCAAGQNLLNLPAYLRATLELSAGYNAAMGLEESPFIFHTGLLLATGLSLVLLWIARFGPRSPRMTVTLGFLAVFSFLKWKHGYVRADGHVYIFFAAVAVIALTAWFAGFSRLAGPPRPDRAGRLWDRIGLVLVTAVTTWALIGAMEFWLGRVPMVLREGPATLQANARFLARPWRARAQLEKALAQVQDDANAPQIRNEVGNGTVDFFGKEEGLLLLNRLRYHPRPMGGGSFNVFNSWLQRENEAFIRDSRRAPTWQVLELQALDDCLPAADDPLTLHAILDCYSPVLMQRDYLLLKRRPAAAPAEPVLLETRPIHPGETVVPPDPGPGRLLLFTLDAPLSLTGRVRAFLYRPPVLTVRIVSRLRGGADTFVLKPTKLRNPVILSPLLLENSDVIQLFGDAPGNTVRSLKITAAAGFAASDFTLSFYSAPRPPKPTDTDINEILTYEKFPLYNRPPANVVTQETGIHELNKEPVTLVHAPGSITWNLAPGDQQLIFSYGLMPQSYLEGRTDGVEFIVEELWPPNDGLVLFTQMLRPRTIEGDRGMHRTRVYLPPYEAGAQLRIRTHPGPDNDAAYDQSYVTRVQIKNGPLVPAQFTGLGVVPAGGRLPHPAIAGINGRPVYLIHAPGEVVLDIPSGARELTCEIGLLPAAYTNGGNSDGVGYTFQALFPGGEQSTLFTRYVDPVHQAGDRGSFRVVVPLPALPAGTQLRIATDVGPRGDRSWDQAFVADARFQ